MPSFLVPTQGDLTAQESPPGNLPSKAKKNNANAQGSAREGGGWAQLELTDALEKHYSFRGPINDRIWHGIDNKLNET